MIFKQFQSYKLIVQGAYQSFKRFPLALLCALFTTVILISIIQFDDPEKHFTLIKLSMTAGLGLPLFIGIVAASESWGWPRKSSLIFQALGLLPLIAYYFSLPPNPSACHTYMVRYILLVITLHFMVAFLPYISGNRSYGFWQYNKSLFLGFLRSALFSAVMYIGLAIALFALKELFGINIPDKRFFQLWVIIAFTFNTWIFVAGIPQKLGELDNPQAYSEILRIFAQYILLPLVGLYLIILYTYEAKIILTWNWPKGWVSQLVSWFSVVGILSMLLLWPLSERTENRWIRIFSRWFFRALVPLIAMLFLVILERVNDYGITVNRYLVLAMAVGLSVLTLYFIFGRKKDIRAIPIIVCLTALLSAYGPWSAFAVSKNSQRARLERYLTQNGILVNNAIVPFQDTLSFENRKDLSAVISYLESWHGPEVFSPWISDSTIKALQDESYRWSRADSITAKFGFAYIPNWRSEENKYQYFSFSIADSMAMPISGYDRFYRFDLHSKDRTNKKNSSFILDADTCFISFCEHPPALNLSLYSGAAGRYESLEIPLTEDISNLGVFRYGAIVDPEQVTFNRSLGGYEVRILIDYIQGSIISDSLTINDLRAFIFLRRINPIL